VVEAKWSPLHCTEISFCFHEIWMIAKIMAGLRYISLFYPTPPLLSPLYITLYYCCLLTWPCRSVEIDWCFRHLAYIVRVGKGGKQSSPEHRWALLDCTVSSRKLPHWDPQTQHNATSVVILQGS
jgi:hypothetical protein